MKRGLKLSAEGQAEFDALRRAFAPENTRALTTPSVDLSALDVTVDLFKEECERAKADFDAWSFEESRDRFRRVVEKADKLTARNDAVNETRMRARCGAAAAMLNLQDLGEAIQLLNEVEEQYLTEQQRSNLCVMLAQLGEINRASAIAKTLGQSEGVSAAKQIVAIAAGEPIAGDVGSSLVFLRQSEQAIAEGRADRAATAALQGVASADKKALVENGLICALMHACCMSLGDLAAPDGRMSAEQLRGALATIESYVAPQKLPAHLAQAYVQTALSYAECSLDHRLYRRLTKYFPKELALATSTSREAIAKEMAKEGAVTGALGLVVGAEWRVQAQRLYLVAPNDIGAATDGIIQLAAQFPGRFPIETLATELALRDGRSDDALKHAETAFSLFPSIGARLLLARSALATQHNGRVLEVVKDMDVQEDDLFLWVLAQASDRLSDPRALSFWDAYLRLRPENRRASISRALALSRMGESDAAADAVIAVVEESAELRIEELIACAQLQLAASPSDDRKARVRRIAQEILQKYGSEPEAQLHAFTLLTGIGEQRGVRVDFESLATTGHVQSLSFDELLETIDARSKLADLALNLYRSGCLTVEAFIRITSGRTASFVGEVLAGRAQLRTSTKIRGHDPIAVVGKRVLLSLIELILIEHLGVFDQVVSALGDGQLLVFDDVWTQLQDDAVFLQQTAERDEATRLSAIAARLATNSKYELVRGPSTDAEVATAQGIACVQLTEGTHDMGWLASVLVDKAAAPIANIIAFVQAHDRRVSKVASTVVPQSLLIDQAVIEGLYMHDLLEATENLFERIVVGPSSIRMLESRRSRIENDLKAKDLMQSVKRSTSRARARGSLALVDRPRVPRLEAVLKEDEKADLIRHAVIEPLAYKQFLLEEREAVRVTAEYVGSLMPSNPDLWKQLAWPSREVAQASWLEFRTTDNREWTLVDLVRVLPDERLRGEALDKLTMLGFQDALDAAELASLHERFGRLDVGKGAAVLDRLESLITSPHDPWAALCRMRLATEYAHTIWEYVKSDDAAKATQVARELLHRAEALGAKASARTSEVVLGQLILLAISNPQYSMTDEEVMVLRKEGGVVELWKQIKTWSDDHEDRRAACRRAISYGWEAIHEYTAEGPTNKFTWAPLALATDKLIPQCTFDRVPQPDAVVAIISALWEQRPLRARTTRFPSGSQIDVEQLLEAGVARMAERKAEVVDESTARFVADVNGRNVEVFAPIEALLLRTKSDEVRRALAQDIARIVGPLDGRLYNALIDYSAQPDDFDVKSALALAACTAPFRLLRDDATLLAYWGEPSTVGQQGYPATVEDLCELLSEPLTFDARPDREIHQRVYDGSWSKRVDRGDLLFIAGRTPGPAIVSIATWAVDDRDPQMWNELARGLSEPGTLPIGRLAQIVALAALAPFHEVEGIEQTVLDDGLRRVITELDRTANSDFAVAEGRCISLVERVIRRLGAARLVSSQQFIWLTFRLYEWWCENTTAEERAEASKNEPAGTGWGAFRWSVILNVLLDVCEMVSFSSRKRPQNLSVLTELLVQRALSEPWTSDQLVAIWKRPQGGGWLAASILLWISPSHFMQLPPEVRLRVFDNLPTETASLHENVLPHMSFVEGIVSNVENFSEEEMLLVKAWLDRLDDAPITRIWRLHIWSRFLARGDKSVHEPLRAIVETVSTDKNGEA